MCRVKEFLFSVCIFLGVEVVEFGFVLEVVEIKEEFDIFVVGWV